MRLFILIAALVAMVSAVEPTVSGSWVVKHLDDKNMLFVDVSGDDAYKDGHIPGARSSDISKWRHDVDKHSEIRSAAELQAELRRLGVDDDTTVIAYSHHLTLKDILKATYVLWAMEYAGVKNSALLDGGIDAFVAAGGELSMKEEPDAASDFVVRTNPKMIASIDEVRAALGKEAMIDSRPAVYYFGAERQGVLKRPGHINEARSYFWGYSLNGDKTLKSEKILRRMFEDGLGLYPSAPVIVYCTGGLEASMNYFVLHRVLGFESARLYDASMKEWANRDDTPMTVYRWE